MLTAFPEAAAGAATAERPHWIDLLDPTAEEIATVRARTGITVPSRAALEEIESSSRLRREGDVLYLSMPFAVHPGSGALRPESIGFVLAPQLLLTVRYEASRAFDHLMQRLRSGDEGLDSPALVFLALIEEMVDVGADTLERLALQVATISREIFHGAAPPRVHERRSQRMNRLLRNTLRAVGALGETLSHIRETILGLQRIVDYAADSARATLGEANCARLASVRKDLGSLADFEAHLSGKVQFLLDAVLGFINTEQNDIFKVLTIVSVVGIPPTLIASIYGMNFHNMPEYTWRYGYQYGLALIAASTIVPMIWFKWRGWW